MIAWYDRYLFYIGIASYLYILSHIIPYDGTYGEYMYFFLTKIEFYSLSVIFGSRISWWTTWAIQILIWASSRSADCPPVESLKVMWKPYHVKQLLACYICVSVCVCKCNVLAINSGKMRFLPSNGLTHLQSTSIGCIFSCTVWYWS